jgi:outer membrane protein assembly factor BamB
MWLMNSYVSSKKTVPFLSVLSIFVIGIFAVSLTHVSAATPLTPDQANWQYVNHDANGTNVNPETQIDSTNAANLQVKWIFPYPGSDATAPGLKTIAFTPGAADPPLVVNGIVYTMTNNMILYALNAKDGSLIWQYQYSVNYTQALATIPITPAGGHIHGINYLPAANGQPAVISFTGMVCDVNAINALSGKLTWSIQNICSNVPGNPPGYLYRGYQDSHPPNVYVNGANGDGIVITAEAGGAPGTVPAARAFMAGYDLKTGQLVWRTITQPPRPNGNSTFAFQWCNVGLIEGVPCTQVTSNPAINTLFKNDWLNPKTGLINFNSGSSGVWGFFPIDQKRGIVLMGTSQASPDYNGTGRPGPNLFAATLFALNATSGVPLWYFQTTTHDIWDNDCSWNGSLGHMTINGAGHDVYVKTCKNGYVYALDELTGKPYWFLSAPGISDRCGNLVGAPASTCNAQKGGYETLGSPTDPNTYTRGWASQTVPGGAAPSFVADGMGASFIENDHAWDVQANVVYIAAHNHPENATAKCSDTSKSGCVSSGANIVDLPNIQHNTTISALSATTGATMWTYMLKLPFRGGVTIGGGPNPVLFAPGFDGNIYMLNAKTGALIGTKYLGTDLAVEISIGATTDGQEQIYVQAGGGGATVAGFGYQNTPGVLVVLGLPIGGASVSTSTTTVTSTAPGGGVTTVTSTAPGGGVTTVTSTAPGGGVTTVTSTAPGGGVTTITSTATGKGVTSTATVTSTAPGGGSVSTTTVTSTTGVDTTTFYAVAGVAVIALVAASFFALRRGSKGGGT